MGNVLDDLIRLGNLLLTFGREVWNFLNYEFVIGSTTIVLSDALFGGAIILVLSYLLVKFVIP